LRELSLEQGAWSGSRRQEGVESAAVKPDKIGDGFLHLLFAGPAGPASGEVGGGSHRLIRRKLAIACKEKVLIGEMRFLRKHKCHRSSARAKRARDLANEIDTAPRDMSRT
jgi:hypothetical protein